MVMSIMHIASAAALIAVLATVPRQAAEPLQPTAKWNVDFGDAHCIAMRNYGTDDAPLVLALKPAPIGDVMQVSVLRVSGKKDTDQYPGTMAVGESAPVKVSVLGYPAKAARRASCRSICRFLTIFPSAPRAPCT